jgi:hypothetical protein
MNVPFLGNFKTLLCYPLFCCKPCIHYKTPLQFRPFSISFTFSYFGSIKRFTKNVFCNRDSNPQPLGRESSTYLTLRYTDKIIFHFFLIKQKFNPFIRLYFQELFQLVDYNFRIILKYT